MQKEEDWGFEDDPINPTTSTQAPASDHDGEDWGFDPASQSLNQAPRSLFAPRPVTLSSTEFANRRTTHSSTIRRQTRTFNSELDNEDDSDEDDWGFGSQQSVVRSLESSPLSQAIKRYDITELKRLIDDGADPKIRDYDEKNLLHFLAMLGPQERAYDLPWEWSSILNRTRQIVNLLLANGVDIETKYKGYLNPTPLESCVQDRDIYQNDSMDYGNGHVIVALLEAQAKVRSCALGGPSIGSLLHDWIKLDAKYTSFPAEYCIVLKTITQKMDNLDVYDQFQIPILTALFRARDIPSKQKQQSLAQLIDPRVHKSPANINTGDFRRSAPLMEVVGHNLDETKILLDAGADPFVKMENGSSLITIAIDTLQDTDSEAVERLKAVMALVEDGHGKSSHLKLIDDTPSLTLASAAFCGRLETVRFLLDSGMHKRQDDVIQYSQNDYHDRKITDFEGDRVDLRGTAMDFAFFGAQYARVRLIWSMSRAFTESERAEVLTTEKAYESYVWKGKYLPARLIDAYWKYPRLLKLLHDHGFQRLQPQNMDREPSFYDAVELPSCRMTTANQPNRENWNCLYDYEILEPDWEEKALEQFVKRLDGFEKISWKPQASQLARFPQLQERVPWIRNADGWCEVTVVHDDWDQEKERELRWGDDNARKRVLVMIENGRIVKMKDLDGRILDPNRR